MATTTQLAPESNIQNLDISTPAILTAEEKRALIEDLRVAYGSYKRSVIEVGRILTALRDGTPHGEWEKFLAVIIGELNISRASAHNFMRAYAEVQFLPEPVVIACEQAGLNLEKTSDRKKVTDFLVLNPDATPEEIVESATTKSPATDTSDEMEAMTKTVVKRILSRDGDAFEHWSTTGLLFWWSRNKVRLRISTTGLSLDDRRILWYEVSRQIWRAGWRGNTVFREGRREAFIFRWRAENVCDSEMPDDWHPSTDMAPRYDALADMRAIDLDTPSEPVYRHQEAEKLDEQVRDSYPKIRVKAGHQMSGGNVRFNLEFWGRSEEEVKKILNTLKDSQVAIREGVKCRLEEIDEHRKGSGKPPVGRDYSITPKNISDTRCLSMARERLDFCQEKVKLLTDAIGTSEWAENETEIRKALGVYRQAFSDFESFCRDGIAFIDKRDHDN